MTRFGFQLYSLRDLDESLADNIVRVAEAGFGGVEFAGRLWDADPTAIRRTLDETGLQPIAAHVELDWLRAHHDEVVASCTTVGIDHLVVPHLSIDRFRTAARRERLGLELVELATALEPADISLAIHTTRELFLPFVRTPGRGLVLRPDGLPTGAYNHGAWAVSKPIRRSQDALTTRTPLGAILDGPAKGHVRLEIDTKSVRTAGFSLATVLDTFGHLTPFVHLSDVQRSRRFPPAYRPVDFGTGPLDPDRVRTTVEEHRIQWAVLEHDAPAEPIESLHHAAHSVGTTDRAATHPRAHPS